ncbi:phosphoserine phosphatase [Catellatospora methionotrophica]|uniref:Phosphoserine phosphatase n=2 Tax=Catellatospora methionotrophica TaxID=121620 RepID=A0A8J3PIR8_9ACTN|nr:phosphoserine phosphatase [Catellatospora methionotrophica]
MARRRSPAPPTAAVGTAVPQTAPPLIPPVIVPMPPAEPATTVADRTGAAFFDVDNTMMQGASLYYLARGLASRRYFTTLDLAKFAISQARFRLLAAEHAGDIAQARQAALAFINGWKVDDVQRLSEEIFDELMADRIWSGTRALADQHLASGQRVWLVTAAPVELGRVIAARLGLTGALGTVAEIRDGAYTGRLVGEMMHGPAKAHAIDALAAAEGLDLTRCTAYSDSINDVPMLTSVGRAVAVNPDSALRRMARAQGWDIRDFRSARKAAKVAVPVALGAGVLAGAVAGGMALSRRRKRT